MIDAFILEALRSPRTKAKESGGLHELTPSDLLAQLYHALVLRTKVDPSSLSEVILGCDTQQGEQAANIAKTSVLRAGWPASVAGMTINRFCSSSIDAIALAAMKVNCGQYVIVAPSHDLVIVRRGLDYGRQGFNRWDLLREVVKAFPKSETALPDASSQ